MSISEFVQIFLSICGGVSIVGGAAAVIFKWITPAFRLNKRVETLEEHDRRDYESLRRIAERDSLILEVLSTMLDSQISGNNVEELKKTKQKLKAPVLLLQFSILEVIFRHKTNTVVFVAISCKGIAFTIDIFNT